MMSIENAVGFNTPEGVEPILATWPKRIYLQSENEHGDGAEPFNPRHEITWCQDKIGNFDIEYVRADTFASPAAPKDAQGAVPELVLAAERLEMAARNFNASKFVIGSAEHRAAATEYQAAQDAMIRMAIAQPTDTTKAAKPLKSCAAGRDGECGHAQCPQLRDGEPLVSGRHCPLDTTTKAAK